MFKILQIAIFFISVFTFSQNVKFKKITEKDFVKKSSILDPSSSSEILQEKIHIEIRYSNRGVLNAVTQVRKRIKIYDVEKTPKQFINVKIPIYRSDITNDKIGGLKAITYNLVNGKVEKNQLKKEDLKKLYVDEYQDQLTFNFPNVQNESILELKYEIHSPFFWETDRFYFQKEIPVLNSELTFIKPEFLEYHYDFQGTLTGNVRTGSTYELEEDYFVETVKYNFQNVKPIKEDAFVNRIENQRTSVKFELLNEDEATTWKKITKVFLSDEFNSEYLKSKDNFTEELSEIIVNQNTDLEKVEAVFDYVRNNYKWDSQFDVFANKNVFALKEDLSGNSAEINLLLIAMLKEAGFESNPVLLGTLENGLVNYIRPKFSQLNHLICSVQVKDFIVLLDATDKNSQIGLMPKRNLNNKGIQIKNDGTYTSLPLINFLKSERNENIELKINTDGSLQGKYSEVVSNFYANEYSNQIKKNQEKFNQSIKDKFSDIQMNNLSSRTSKDGKKVKVEFDFNSNDFTKVEENKIILKPFAFMGLKENPFNLNERTYPIEYNTPFKQTKTVKIKIPDGFKVENIPSRFQQTLKNNVSGFVIQMNQKDNYLIITSIFECKQSVLLASYFSELKELYDKIVENESQEISLKKID